MSTKRNLVAAAMAVLMGASLSGCTLFGGEKVDVAKESAIIQVALNDWDAALEAYKVDGMVAPLASEFSLTIKENGVAQEAKNLTKLKEELEANAANQKLMREKYGYSIKIDWDDIVIDVTDAANAKVNATFDTAEDADNTPAGTIIAEDGTLEATAVKVNDKWSFSTMTLNFNPEDN